MLKNAIEQTEAAKIYSVAELNFAARQLLENNFPSIWVEGEISNLAQPGSGHSYFTLKDTQAQISCAMFKQTFRQNNVDLQNGIKVLARGKLSLYAPRGNFQLIIDYVELAGDGILKREFEKLKNKLLAEGLFAQGNKKPIPSLPKQIGVITSPTGAAIKDILCVIKRRFPGIAVIIYPTLVQGEKASQQIVTALQLANKHNACDVLIVARGGGSLEDLWPFNEENVARAIYASTLPIVTGIGHEIDFTIADFVADHRAPTPSAAAELVTPNQEFFLHQLKRHYQRLDTSLRRTLNDKKQHLDWLIRSLRHPGQKLQDQLIVLQTLKTRLLRARCNAFINYQNRLNQLKTKLYSYSPQHHVNQSRHQLLALNQSLQHRMQIKLRDKQQQLQQLSTTLNALSPLATLQRGYAIVIHSQTQQVVSNAEQIKIDDELKIKLQQGELTAKVTHKK